MTAEERLQAVEDAVNTLESQILNKIPRTDASDALLELEGEVTAVQGLTTQLADRQLEINDRVRKLTVAFQASQGQ